LKKENYFITLFATKKNGIGDDGVVKNGFVYSQDAFFEGVHFKREWARLEDIAKKAMLVNISDALAMNAKPLYALLSVALPKNISKNELDRIAEGINSCAKRFGVQIIGGDTISNVKLDFSITIISKPISKPVYRKGVKRGHEVAFTGSLGSVAKELRYALRGIKPSSRSKLITPRLQDSFLYGCGRYMSALMDISDGLFFELQRLSILNKVGFKMYKKIEKKIGCSGEEYELLFSYPPKLRETFRRRAKRSRVAFVPFGKAVRGRFKHICREHHF